MTRPHLTPGRTRALSALTAGCTLVLARAWTAGPDVSDDPLIAALALGGIGFAGTYAGVVWTAPVFAQRGFRGKDLGKGGARGEIPEGMGLIAALVYLLMVIVFLPFAFKRHVEDVTTTTTTAAMNEGRRGLHRFPLEKLASYGFAYGTLASVIILGILDDTFDMRWRHKFFIPAVAALPMLGLYLVDYGVTHVVVPQPLRKWTADAEGRGGDLVDLGALYYVYMAAVAIFCPNSINILAGINGIEVGQSLVIAGLLVLNDALYLVPATSSSSPSAAAAAAEGHLFSTSLLLPFIGVSLGVGAHNAFPARVFVGDTYCYFAGMLFAVVGILGHFSKTLMVLFLPQVANFVYSLPQLLHVVPCPRHRLPRFDARSGRLDASMVALPLAADPSAPDRRTTLVAAAARGLDRLGLARVERDARTDRVTAVSNLTLLNVWLVWRGPLSEGRLAGEVLTAQLAVGLVGLWCRHGLARFLFVAADNR